MSVYSEYKQPTEENKAQAKKYARAVQEDYSDKLGYAMGILASALIGIISIVYIVLFAM